MWTSWPSFFGPWAAPSSGIRPKARRIRIDVPAEITPVAPYDIVERFRASVVVLGPMLARCGEAKVALPGGDDFGPRPVDMHVRGLVELGAQVDVVHGYIEASATELLGGRVLLEFPSVGATENLLMAAVAAKGHHRDRQRGPRARDIRPLPVPRPHGSPHLGCRHVHPRRRGCWDRPVPGFRRTTRSSVTG